MPKNTDQRIVEALTGTAEDPHAKRVQEALSGGEYLWGLKPPENEDAVRVWAAKESLKGAAERYAHAGTTRLSDLHMEQIVGEVWEATNPDWPDVDRMERTAVILNRQAARFEEMDKRR